MIYRLPELSDAQSSGHSLSADPGSRICHLQADGCVLHRNHNLRGVSFFLFHLKKQLETMLFKPVNFARDSFPGILQG